MKIRLRKSDARLYRAIKKLCPHVLDRIEQSGTPSEILNCFELYRLMMMAENWLYKEGCIRQEVHLAKQATRGGPGDGG